MPLSSRKEVVKFVHRKLLFRLRRFAIVFIIITGVLIWEISKDYIGAYLAAVGFVFGLIIGLLISRRMHNISWDVEANKVVTKMDRLGIIILIIYLLFAISRHWIFGHWLQGYALTAFCISISAGGMIGRLWTTRQKIREVLKREGMLYPSRNKEE